jgi:nucleoside phosphorylase
MFFSASARLADATADLGDLAERFDAWLKDANESWLIESDNVAASLREHESKVEYLLAQSAIVDVGLLVADRYVRCEKCRNLIPIEEVEDARENEEPLECSQCGAELAGAESEAIAYRLSAAAAEEARVRRERPRRRIAILTALDLELQAVLARLDQPKRDTSLQGTVYLVGTFQTEAVIWEVATVAIGAGNPGAAAEAERVIAHFDPESVFFVGIAGGIKDVALGDVVVPDQVFLHESGKESATFRANPVGFRPTQGLLSNAQATAALKQWQTRITEQPPTPPTAVIEPIVAGEQVVVSVESVAYERIRENYGRAVAVEMEGAGFLRGAWGNLGVGALVVRGISDLLDNKDIADADGGQARAADHAAAFAFEVIANIDAK